jgi:hypothetical protein
VHVPQKFNKGEFQKNFVFQKWIRENLFSKTSPKCFANQQSFNFEIQNQLKNGFCFK